MAGVEEEMMGLGLRNTMAMGQNFSSLLAPAGSPPGFEMGLLL